MRRLRPSHTPRMRSCQGAVLDRPGRFRYNTSNLHETKGGFLRIMDTDGGDNPGNTLICHTVFASISALRESGRTCFFCVFSGLILHKTLTEKEFTTLSTTTCLIIMAACLILSAYFFGHRDGVFLGQQHEAQNPRGEGQQKKQSLPASFWSITTNCSPRS